MPRLCEGEPRTLFRPVEVPDRTDGQLVHLDGLNLSRAWCWRCLANIVEDVDTRQRILKAADEHLTQSMDHILGDYAGRHWLATFAVLALTDA